MRRRGWEWRLRTGSRWNGSRGQVDKGELEGLRPNRLSPFLRPFNTVRMPLFSGLKAFRGPRKTKKEDFPNIGDKNSRIL